MITEITYESKDRTRRAFIRRVRERLWQVSYVRLSKKTGSENYDQLHTDHESLIQAQQVAREYTQ